MSTLAYDPKHPISYGYYSCPECKAQFYGGGPALHSVGCSQSGYHSCTYHFGPEHVEQLKSLEPEHGADFNWYGITLNQLRKQFPELL